MNIQAVSIHSDRWNFVGSGAKINGKPEKYIWGSTMEGAVPSQALPKDSYQISYSIAALHDPRVELVRDIPIAVEFFEGVVTAWNSDLEEWGTGKTETEAVDELRASIVEAYFLYKDEGEGGLGPIPIRHWRYLKSIIREI